jgi:hypothetical protein
VEISSAAQEVYDRMMNVETEEVDTPQAQPI